MEFSKFQTQDFERINKYLFVGDNESCETGFMTLYIWQKLYGTCFAVSDDILITRFGDEKTGFFYLLPFTDHEKGFGIIREITGLKYPPFFLPEGKALSWLKENYGEYYHFAYTPDNDDYIYKTSDLAELKGKKYHSKRNHIAAFSKMYDWKYESISADNIASVRECAEKWYTENYLKDDEDLEAEKSALFDVLDNFFKLPVFGGLIDVNGKTVAFTIGSEISKNVADVHFEKALGEYMTAYSVINREFAKKELNSFEFLNREDDMGLEGLRKAKLSYHPVKKIKKYFCFAKQNSFSDRFIGLYSSAFGWNLEFEPKLFSDFENYIKYREENGEIISMFFLIPCELSLKDKTEKAYYLYAAATAENKRGQGFMSGLILKTLENIDGFVILKPAESALIPFYEKLGFKQAVINKNSDNKIKASKPHKDLQKYCRPVSDGETVMAYGKNLIEIKDIDFSETLE